MKRSVLIVLLGVLACSRRSSDAEKAKPDEVVWVKNADPKMGAAITQARATLPTFRAALASPPAGAENFSVKVGFVMDDSAEREHIWLGDVKLTETQVSDAINNEPVSVSRLKLGQQVTAPLEDVSDWMYVEGGVLRGGFTLRVLLDKMSPEGRKKMLDDMGVRLE
jgi:uncharacterized protein YegJ (DUF2314 family)